MNVQYVKSLAVTMLASAVAAQRNFDCYAGTNFSSAGEAFDAISTPTDCIGSFSDGKDLIFRSDHMAVTVSAFVPLAFAALLILIFPLVTFLRCCCNICIAGPTSKKILSRGSSNDPYGDDDEHQPHGTKGKHGKASTPAKKQCCTWSYLPWSSGFKKVTLGILIASVIIAIIWVVALSVQGTVRAPMSIERVARQLLDELVNDVEVVRSRLLLDGTSNPPTYVEPLKEDDFDRFYADGYNPAVENINEYADLVRPYVTKAVIGGIFAGLVPSILIAIAAFFPKCYRSSPRAYAIGLHSLLCLSFLFIIFFAIVSAGFFLVGNLVTDVCGERELFLKSPSEPGLISYMALPACEENFNASFEENRQRVVDGERTVAELTCEQLLTICDATDTYANERPYRCGNLTNKAQCTDYFTARGTGTTLQMKPAAPVRCGDVTGTVPYNVSDFVDLPEEYNQYIDTLVGSGGIIQVPNVSTEDQFLCPIQTCQSQCNETDAAVGSSLSVRILNEADVVHATIDQHIEPYLTCRRIITRALDKWTTCDDTVAILFMLAVAAFIFMFLLFLLIMVIWISMQHTDDSICSTCLACCCKPKKEKPLVATPAEDRQLSRHATPIPTPVNDMRAVHMPEDDDEELLDAGSLESERDASPVAVQPRDPDTIDYDHHDIWTAASRRKFANNPMIRKLGEKIYDAEGTDGIITTVTKKRGDRVIDSMRVSQPKGSTSPEGPQTTRNTPRAGAINPLTENDIVKKPLQFDENEINASPADVAPTTSVYSPISNSSSDVVPVQPEPVTPPARAFELAAPEAPPAPAAYSPVARPGTLLALAMAAQPQGQERAAEEEEPPVETAQSTMIEF